MKDTEQLRQNFERAVQGYVTAFIAQWELSPCDCYWVGDRTGLDVFCFGDYGALTLDDMVFCIEEGVTLDEYMEYTEYGIKCHEYDLPLMNLKSWHRGAPRHSFATLDALKKDLDEAVRKEKERL